MLNCSAKKKSFRYLFKHTRIRHVQRRFFPIFICKRIISLYNSVQIYLSKIKNVIAICNPLDLRSDYPTLQKRQRLGKCSFPLVPSNDASWLNIQIYTARMFMNYYFLKSFFSFRTFVCRFPFRLWNETIKTVAFFESLLFFQSNPITTFYFVK